MCMILFSQAIFLFGGPITTSAQWDARAADAARRETRALWRSGLSVLSPRAPFRTGEIQLPEAGCGDISPEGTQTRCRRWSRRAGLWQLFMDPGPEDPQFCNLCDLWVRNHDQLAWHCQNSLRHLLRVRAARRTPDEKQRREEDLQEEEGRDR